MMKRVLRGLAAFLIMALGEAALAASGPAAAEFSADMFQRTPQGQEIHGKIFVGDERMRTEMEQNGQEMIQIIDSANGKQWMIFPAQKTYMEQPAPPGAPYVGGGETNPCAAMPGAECTRLGEEEVDGRPAEKWAVTFVRQGQQQRLVQWLDKERGLPLRQELPDGQRMELALAGEEQLGGRPVEKWAVTLYQGDQAPARSAQWYDPELKITIREEYPGGFVREFRNIQVGEQADALFELPAGYQRMQAPSQGSR